MTLYDEVAAIQQALNAGGFIPPDDMFPFKFSVIKSAEATRILARRFEKVVLDPAFWQALGKARAWDTRLVLPFWKRYALEYFETRLSGGDTSAFWQSLP